jgi:DNA-binding phage protein
MENVKAPTSISYQDYLISHLKDPNYAATYLETHLEGDSEPELLQLALNNICAALTQVEMPPEQAILHQQKLNDLLAKSGGQAICDLVPWLDDLGLKLTIVAKPH